MFKYVHEQAFILCILSHIFPELLNDQALTGDLVELQSSVEKKYWQVGHNILLVDSHRN